MSYLIDERPGTYIVEAIKYANKYGLNPKLVKGIIEQESSGNIYAQRYEPNYKYLFNPEKYAKRNRFSLDTEIMGQKTSWGLMQIMGGTARWLGFSDPLGALIIPEINIDYGCKYLHHLETKYQNDLDIIAAYNAGRAKKDKSGNYINQAYVDSVKGHMEIT